MRNVTNKKIVTTTIKIVLTIKGVTINIKPPLRDLEPAFNTRVGFFSKNSPTQPKPEGRKQDD
jgi:hypothetical protein